MAKTRWGTIIDVEATTAQARARWEARQRKRVSIQEKIGNTVPWWLVIIALIMFLLSAPHTATMFEQITPLFGYAAPLGIEFGLLYYAFRLKQVRQSGDSPPGYLHPMGWLIVGISVLVNGAGSLQAVVATNEATRQMPMAELVGEFGGLPASSQVALILAPLAALFIPAGTLVAGEGLADLFLERSERGNVLAAQWERERGDVVYRALRNAALREGATPAQAEKWASAVVHKRSERSERSPRSAGDQPDTLSPLVMNALERLEQDEHLNTLSTRALADELGVSVGTAHKAKRAHTNGRH